MRETDYNSVIYPGGPDKNQYLKKRMTRNSMNDYQSAIEGYKLFFSLRITADAIHKAREQELKKYGISPQQSLALVCIYSMKNKATPAELSRWVFREPNSITILLNRMEKMGLIKKKADIKRKNIIRLSLTKKGLEAYKHAVEFQTFYKIINVLPEDKRKQLFSLLKELREEVFQELRLNVNSYSDIMDRALFKPAGSDIELKDDRPV